MLTLPVTIVVTWDPVRTNDKAEVAKTFRQLLQRTAVFQRPPDRGDEIKLGGEYHRVASFFHDLDKGGQLEVRLSNQWNMTPTEARERVAHLVAQGWEAVDG